MQPETVMGAILAVVPSTVSDEFSDISNPPEIKTEASEETTTAPEEPRPTLPEILTRL